MNQVIAAIVGVIVLVVVFAAILALPTMWLWNWLLPDLFGFKEIGFLQALGLLVLSGLLLKSSSGSTSSK